MVCYRIASARLLANVYNRHRHMTDHPTPWQAVLLLGHINPSDSANIFASYRFRF
jgi:hypothetical protein